MLLDIVQPLIRVFFFGELLLPSFYDKKKTGIDKNLPKLKNAIMSAHRNQVWRNSYDCYFLVSVKETKPERIEIIFLSIVVWNTISMKVRPRKFGILPQYMVLYILKSK